VPPGRWTVRVTDDAGKTTEGVVQTTPSAPASLRL